MISQIMRRCVCLLIVFTNIVTILFEMIVVSQSDLYVPLSELVRTVQVYSDSWQGKSETLKVIHEQQER